MKTESDLVDFNKERPVIYVSIVGCDGLSVMDTKQEADRSSGNMYIHSLCRDTRRHWNNIL